MTRAILFGAFGILVSGVIAAMPVTAHSASAADGVPWENRQYPGANRGIEGIHVRGHHVQLGLIGETARSLDGGETWTLGVLDTPTIVNGFCWAGSRMYAATEWNRVMYSDDSGLAWKRYSKEGMEPTAFKEVFANHTYLFAKSYEGLYRVPLGGSVWQRLDLGGTGLGGFWGFIVLGEALIATKNRQIHLSYDHGVTWTRPPSGLTDSLAIRAGPILSGSLVYAADSASVLVSRDSGITWTRSFPGIPDGSHIRSIAAHGDQVFVHAHPYYLPVFRSTDQGRTWNPFGTGLPIGTTIYYLAANEDFLYTFTPGGRGYWRIPIATPTSLVPRAPAQRRATRTWKSGIGREYSLLGRWVRVHAR
jgi:photosystem II stability/assembly factor-like uncharacterized protein